LPGKWQAAILKAKQSRPKLRVVADNQSRQGCQRAEREPGEEGRAVEGAPSTRLVEFVKKENLFHRLPIHRSRVDRVFYSATKHYGVWFMKVRMNLPDAVIAAQAGWSERSVTKMVETYGHATDDRRLDEIDAAFQTQIQTQASPIPLREPS
jgi:hypothetical protein